MDRAGNSLAEAEELVRFITPAGSGAAFAGLDTACLECQAAAYGLPKTTLLECLYKFARDRQVRVSDLSDLGYETSLPVSSRVVAIGDSITEDRLSWASLWGAIAKSCSVTVAGRSGATSADALAAVVEQLSRPVKANLFVILIGTNDARVLGDSGQKPFVNLSETRCNLAEIARMISAESSAKLFWMTPTGITRDLCLDYGQGAEVFRKENLDAVIECVRDRPEPVLDLQRVFLTSGHQHLVEEDGLHPNSKGQALILTTLMSALAGALRFPVVEEGPDEPQS